MREFYVSVEQDEDGMYVGEVPHLPACYTQGRTLDELLHNTREVIALCLEEMAEDVLCLESDSPLYVDLLDSAARYEQGTLRLHEHVDVWAE